MVSANNEGNKSRKKTERPNHLRTDGHKCVLLSTKIVINFNGTLAFFGSVNFPFYSFAFVFAAHQSFRINPEYSRRLCSAPLFQEDVGIATVQNTKVKILPCTVFTRTDVSHIIRPPLSDSNSINFNRTAFHLPSLFR